MMITIPTNHRVLPCDFLSFNVRENYESVLRFHTKDSVLIYKQVYDVLSGITMRQDREKYTRALPFVRVLDKSKSSVHKREILKTFPKFVTNDIIELLHNILIGKLSIKAYQKKALAKHKDKMLEFVDLPTLKMRRKFIHHQKGGFLGTILPIIASALTSLFT
jgi:hypothetical protein